MMARRTGRLEHIAVGPGDGELTNMERSAGGRARGAWLAARSPSAAAAVARPTSPAAVYVQGGGRSDPYSPEGGGRGGTRGGTGYGWPRINNPFSIIGRANF